VDTLQTETKGTIRITTAKELTDFSHGEENLMEEHILDIVKAGCKLVISGGKVGELALHYANKHGLMVVRLNSKFDIRRLCSAIGATPLPRMTPPTAEECGHVSLARIEEIGGTTVVVFRQAQGEGSVSTIVLRGSTDNILDNAESAVDDGVNTYKCLTKNSKLVPGAGAAELEIAKQLGAIADKAPGLEQYAMRKYANSFEVVVRALSENYGLKATEMISQLYAAHQQGRVNDGLVIANDTAQVADAKEAGVLDLYLVKHWAIKFATTAACTILRVDKIIMAKPAGGPKPKENPDWDE
jgi:T-complex protein 1 subunit theta